jgi:hypothetical protein
MFRRPNGASECRVAQSRGPVLVSILLNEVRRLYKRFSSFFTSLL